MTDGAIAEAVVLVDKATGMSKGSGMNFVSGRVLPAATFCDV
jgi:hypothetical protein